MFLAYLVYFDFRYTSYEDQHPYPKDCPRFDPNYDISPDLYKRVPPLPSPIEEALEELKKEKVIPVRPPGPSLIRHS